MQDMEKLLQEHRENAQVDDQLEVSFDGFDDVDELSMFLDTPTSKAQVTTETSKHAAPRDTQAAALIHRI